MSEDHVAVALRSSARLVVVEAPAGCGKTYQAAQYARELCTCTESRTLLLAHTHAACDVFSYRTRGLGSRVDIRTIDSLICEIARVYHQVLDLPVDTGAWARCHNDGYHKLAKKVAGLVAGSPFIAQSLAQEADYRRWESLKQAADAIGELDRPHRWLPQGQELGEWILSARSSLLSGKPIDLRGQLPRGVSIIFAENKSPRPRGYYIDRKESAPIYRLISGCNSIVMLTTENDTVDSLRGMFRLPIWEGHVRKALNTLIAAVQKHKGEPNFIGESVVTFIESVTTGFSRSAYSDRFLKEIQNKCLAKLRGKPSKLQALGQRLLVQADHKGVADVFQGLDAFMRSDQDFKAVRLDYCREFWDAMRLGNFEDPQEAFAELARRRSYARLSPPSKAISTIHKAKGLEFSDIVVIPCDSRHFPNTVSKRCLLYVAMSRAVRSLTFVISRTEPSPLLQV
jgi:hypothetical protein